MTGDINRKRAHFEVDDVDNNKIKRTEDRKRKPEKEYQSQQSEEAKTLFSKIVSSTGRFEKYELVLPLKIIKIINWTMFTLACFGELNLIHRNTLG